MWHLRRLLLSALMLASVGVEASSVECTVVVRSETHTMRIEPADTPYEVTKLDFDNGFRFAGQLLKEPLKLKTYTYFDSKDRYVLIHVNAQTLSDQACGKPLGENTIYSPRLENELSYHCILLCDKP
ncbi:hypothetical protein [Fluviibacter phosphoraccumulans]|uniref:Uncharacterized protein n=1 Tax=Fluviibacter phosphoraccumulans TaxID=1751046 RepID=A0A679HS75_9RHOO|nr:hypothetical protein [Fluviibacter phosphoraccumulans]BBU68487.1 hypothetical protein ICHIAU1_07700 [Fluviibacter phosphoraccumulans]BBU72358.1 hypothetical protein ICHIJ1_22770 [Fluviibacter phosphoraccumulans]BCA64401.1 hypothetical protein SHINM1_000030 [Fluviibacter phosphoraccumulans]